MSASSRDEPAPISPTRSSPARARACSSALGFDFSAYYVRDPDLLVRVMSTNPSFLRTAQDGVVKNFRDWHIQLGRRFRSLKLWFLLLDVGVEGLRTRLRRDLANAAWLAEQVAAAPDEAGLRAHNLAIARRINESGRAYVTPSMLKGKQIIRVSIGAETTERRHVEALWQQLQAAATATS